MIGHLSVDLSDAKMLLTVADMLVVMDDSRIRNWKSRFFPRIEKKTKSRFYNKLVHQFLLTWNTFIFDCDNVATYYMHHCRFGNC